MSNRERRNIDFDKLNLLGKAVYVSGSAFKLVTGAINTVHRTAESIYKEAEEAFREGLEGEENISDARIIDEARDET